MSIKKKLVTAVTTAGLLAGLFGSAFVPAARAAANVLDAGDYDFKAATYVLGESEGVCAINNTTNKAIVLKNGTFSLITTEADLTDADAVYSLTYSGVAGSVTKVTPGQEAGTSTFTGLFSVNATAVKHTQGNTALTDDPAVLVAYKTQATGTLTIKLRYTAGSTTPLNVVESWTVTVVDSCTGQSGGYTAANSGAKLDTAANVLAAVPSSDTSGAATKSLGQIAYLALFLRDAIGNAVDDAVLTITATGGATVSWTAADTSSIKTSDSVASGVTNEVAAIFGDDSSPLTTTVTVTLDGVVVATRTITFQGEIASITLTQERIAEVGGTIADVISYVAKDSAGNQLAGYSPTLDSDSVDYVTALANVGATSATASADADVTCGATAGQDQLKVTQLNSDGDTITSNAVTITCAEDAIDTYTMSWDKTSYVAGETATLTVRGYDDNGFPMSDTSTFDPGGTAADVTWTASGLTLAAGEAAPSGSKIFADGEFKVVFTVSTTIGSYTSTMFVKDAKTDKTVESTSVVVGTPTLDGTLSVGSNKRVATADFGAAAAGKKIAFILENAGGKTKTYYRKANASGKASYTLALRGTWTVYASYGDDITDTGTLRK